MKDKESIYHSFESWQESLFPNFIKSQKLQNADIPNERVAQTIAQLNMRNLLSKITESSDE